MEIVLPFYVNSKQLSFVFVFTGCHTLIKQKNATNNGPGSTNTVKTNPPCGPCKENVPSQCPLHANVEVKCHKRFDKCEETCSRLMGCEMHQCNKICHEKIDPTGCGVCVESCSKPRPLGCNHQCDLGCHQVIPKSTP